MENKFVEGERYQMCNDQITGILRRVGKELLTDGVYEWYADTGKSYNEVSSHDLKECMEAHPHGTKYTLDKLNKALEEKEPHWTVRLMGSGEPSFKHTSEVSAFTEARRLLGLYAPGGHTKAIIRGYGVDAIVATFESVREIKEVYTDGRAIDDDLPF